MESLEIKNSLFFFFYIVGMKASLIKSLEVGFFLLETEEAWLNWFSDSKAFNKSNIY